MPRGKNDYIKKKLKKKIVYSSKMFKGNEILPMQRNEKINESFAPSIQKFKQFNIYFLEVFKQSSFFLGAQSIFHFTTKSVYLSPLFIPKLPHIKYAFHRDWE